MCMCANANPSLSILAFRGNTKYETKMSAGYGWAALAKSFEAGGGEAGGGGARTSSPH